jgi:4-amino-4-deoxychorismate lyase
MILINGVATDRVDALDRGLHYGDGLFETLAVRAGLPLLWQRHMQRLTAGCERLGIPSPDESLLEQEAAQLCAGVAQGVLKIIVTRGTGGRGYRPPPAPQPTRVVALYPWPDYPPATQGIMLRVCATRLAQNPALAGMKHLNRLEQVLARNEWDDPAIVEGVMLDSVGRVISGTMSNLFLVKAGALFTPDVTQCGVAGVMRGLILDVAARLGMTARIGAITLNDVLEADEVFVCNSLVGLWPVRQLAGRRYPHGPFSTRIAAEIREYTV